MKITQELPKDQKEILVKAVNLYLAVIEVTPDYEGDNSRDYLKFDLITLKGMLSGNVVCEFTPDQVDEFTQNNGVDFPEYTISLK